MPNDTLDEIEAWWKDVPPWMATLRDGIATWPAMIGKAWAEDLFERHDEAVSAICTLIEMVRARDRVMQAARRTSMIGHRLHIPTRMMDEVHELDDVLAALDTPPAQEQK